VMERARNRHAGGDAQWKRWRAALADSVLPHQRRDTDLCGYRGSWDPIGPWGPDGGRVYSTALLTMCMAMASR